MTRSTNDKAQFVCKRFANEVGDVQLKSLNFMDANQDQPQAKAIHFRLANLASCKSRPNISKTNVIHNSLQSNTAKLRLKVFHIMLSNQQCFSEENVQTLSEQRVCYLFAQKLKIWTWNICRRFLGYLLQGLGSGCRIGGFENQLKGLTIPTGLTCQDFQTCLFTRIHRSEAFFKVNTRECSESFEDVNKH